MTRQEITLKCDYCYSPPLPPLHIQIGTDFLEEEITAFEDIVQSVDIAAFNKV